MTLTWLAHPRWLPAYNLPSVSNHPSSSFLWHSLRDSDSQTHHQKGLWGETKRNYCLRAENGVNLQGSLHCNSQCELAEEEAEGVWRQKTVTGKPEWEVLLCFCLPGLDQGSRQQEVSERFQAVGNPFSCFLLERKALVFPWKRSWTSWRVRQPEKIVTLVQFINTRWQPLTPEIIWICVICTAHFRITVQSSHLSTPDFKTS